jgi:serine/threonine protein kinase
MSPEALKRTPEPPASAGWQGLRLKRAIGRGRNADVWCAELAGASMVAVKFPVAAFSHAEALALVRAEAQLLDRLSHPHIVRRVGDCAPGEARYADGTAEPRPGLVLEWLAGGDLVGMAGLPAQHWCEAALAVADALAHVHAEGYVHGDIKARNVMLAADGSARLVDFATCRPRGFFCAEPIGTPLQQRPRSRGHIVSEDDDWFAFAALLYELLAGQPPFVDECARSDQRPVPLERSNRPLKPGERMLASAVWAMLTARRSLDRGDALQLRAALAATAPIDLEN